MAGEVQRIVLQAAALTKVDPSKECEACGSEDHELYRVMPQPALRAGTFFEATPAEVERLTRQEPQRLCLLCTWHECDPDFQGSVEQVAEEDRAAFISRRHKVYLLEKRYGLPRDEGAAIPPAELDTRLQFEERMAAKEWGRRTYE